MMNICSRPAKTACSGSSRFLRLCLLLLLYLPGGICQARVDAAASGESSVSCSVSSTVTSKATESDAFARNLVEIGSFLCSAAGSADAEGTLEIETEVVAVASAIAEVVSEINFACSLQGDAVATVGVRTQAASRAQAAASAVARVLESSTVCGDCAARVASFVTTTEEVIAEASLDSMVELELRSTPTQPVEERQRIFQRSVQKNVKEAISRVSISIRRTPDSEFGCQVSGGIEASVSPAGASRSSSNSNKVPGSFAACDFSAVGRSRAIEEEAIVALGAEARAFACEDGFAEDTVDLTLSSTAKALAEAVSQVDVFCRSQGGPETTGCALGEANIRATATTTAQAFVRGLVEAGTCVCNESVTLDTSKVEEVFAEASSRAFAKTCTSGTGSSFATDFQLQLDEQLRSAVARVVLEATAIADSDSGKCLAQVSLCAGTSECAKQRQQCRGSEIGGEPGRVLPCCDGGFVCTKRSSAEARCQPEGAKLPRFYDGTIEPPTCNVP